MVGRPSSSELQVMGDVCKMDEEGIELLKYIDNLPNEECEITSPLSEKCTSASASAMDLLGKMLRFSPSERISAVDALNHPYFQEFGLRPSQVILIKIPSVFMFIRANVNFIHIQT